MRVCVNRAWILKINNLTQIICHEAINVHTIKLPPTTIDTLDIENYIFFFLFNALQTKLEMIIV